MASSNNPTIKLALIHSLTGSNPSRCDGVPLFADDKERRKLVNAMMPGFNPAVGTMGVTEMTEAEVATAITEREAKWAKLKANSEKFDITEALTGKKVEVSASDLLTAWEATYTKSEKVIAPKWAVVWAHRRHSIMHHVVAVRTRLEMPADVAINIPAIVRHYDNDGDKALDALKENEGKKVGFRELSWADKLHGARRMFRDALAEIRFREVWSTGTAQKLFATCQLDQQYPDLTIYDRVMSGGLDLSKFNKEDLRKLAAPKEATVTSTIVEELLSNPESKKDKVKMTTKKEIETVAKQSPIIFVRELMSAVLVDELTIVLRKYNVDCDSINAAFAAATVEAEAVPEKEIA